MRNWRRAVAGMMTVLGAVAWQVALAAFQAQGGFVKVPESELAAQEKLPATPLVFIAYAFVWAAVFFYVFTIWRRLGRVERELADVTKKLQSRPGSQR